MPVLFFENCGDISTMGHKGPCDSQKYPQIQQKLRYPKNLVTVNHAFRDMLPGQFIASRDVRVGHRGFMDLFLCQMFLLACSYASDRTTKSQQISNSIRQMYQVLSDFFFAHGKSIAKTPWTHIKMARALKMPCAKPCNTWDVSNVAGLQRACAKLSSVFNAMEQHSNPSDISLYWLVDTDPYNPYLHG